MIGVPIMLDDSDEEDDDSVSDEEDDFVAMEVVKLTNHACHRQKLSSFKDHSVNTIMVLKDFV